jgi:hypothetical protein
MYKSFRPLWHFCLREWRALLLGASLALAVLLAGGFLLGALAPAKTKPNEPEPTPPALVHRSTDGVLIKAEEQPVQWYAVMVENSAEAWPLSGIGQARLVIEAQVEGAIPRLSAYFDDTQEVETIGPVRSVRPYYVRWASGFNAMLAHVGGSPEALDFIKAQNIITLNQFFWDPFFWRSTDRYAPHNVYTSVAKLKEGAATRHFAAASIPSFSYVEQETLAEQRSISQDIRLSFSSSKLYQAYWVYDRQANNYRRFQNDQPFLDALTQFQITAKNIVILKTKVDVIDEVGRRAIATEGQGVGYLCRDGRCSDITWSKSASNQPLQLWSGANMPAQLNPGRTWIEVLPLSTTPIIHTEAAK